MSTDAENLISQNGKTAAAIAKDQQDAIDLALQVRYAAALGWAMTELLGRCYLLETGYHIPPDHPEFSVEHPVILSPVLDPLERICTVTGRILFLAEQLQVEECKIKHISLKDAIKTVLLKDAIQEISDIIDEMSRNSDSSRDAHEHVSDASGSQHLLVWQSSTPHAHQAGETITSVKVLNGLVQKLSSSTVNLSAGQLRQTLCVAINFFLFYWGESIQIALQKHPPAIYNAYTVGRGFATIRWYIGVGLAEAFSAKVGQPGYKRPEKLVTVDALNKLGDHLHSISCYLPPFSADALDYSLSIWGQAIIDNISDLNAAIKQDQGEKIAKNRGEQPPANDHVHKKPSKARQKSYERMRIQLIKQSIIWHDLLSGDRDPTSYVNPQSITWRFTRWLVVIGTGFLVLGVIFFAAIFFAVTHIQNIVLQQPLTKPTAGTPQSITDTIITAVATIPLIRTLWVWAARTTTNFTTTFMAKKGDAIYGEVSTSGKDALHLLWQKSQQEAINKAAYRSPKPPLPLRVFPFLLRIPKKDGDGDDGD